jgi:hypothetical protein
MDDIQNQFIEATFSPGLRFNYLRLVVTHRWCQKRRTKNVVRIPNSRETQLLSAAPER